MKNSIFFPFVFLFFISSLNAQAVCKPLQISGEVQFYNAKGELQPLPKKGSNYQFHRVEVGEKSSLFIVFNKKFLYLPQGSFDLKKIQQLAAQSIKEEQSYLSYLWKNLWKKDELKTSEVGAGVSRGSRSTLILPINESIISTDQLYFSWTTLQQCSKKPTYIIELFETGKTDPIVQIETPDTTIQIPLQASGLIPETTYEYHIIPICDDKKMVVSEKKILTYSPQTRNAEKNLFEAAVKAEKAGRYMDALEYYTLFNQEQNNTFSKQVLQLFRHRMGIPID
jgi:hypothetical protein